VGTVEIGVAWAPLALLLLLVGCSEVAKVHGLAQPETVLHDEVADVYLVSNVVGKGSARDGVAFIARIDPERFTVDLDFVRAGRDGVELHAPKGLAIVADTLFVADLDHVRRFHRTTGRPLGDIRVPGARALNGMASDPAGNVYVGDTGWDEHTKPTGVDAIWRLDPAGRLSRLVGSPSLGEPNGLHFVDGRLHFVSWAKGTLSRLEADGQVTLVRQLSEPLLDGLVRFEGAWLFSSWHTAKIHRARGDRVEVVTGAYGCAGFAIDHKRRRLLIPAWEQGFLRIRKL